MNAARKSVRLSPRALVALAAGLWTCARAHAADLPAGFVEETLAANLNAATALAPLPDGRILIAEQTGRLLLWKNGALADRPALTLHVTDYWERGLIGVTTHPDFPRTPHVFVLYVTDRPFVHHVLSRFTMKGDAIDPASEKVLLEGDDQAELGGKIPHGHQGGPLRFGNDGKLYAGIGEQTAETPAQRLDTLQGKILRINADGGIPEDNPFFTRAGGKYRAIWAYGVRNPFGLAVQRETGRMFFTDVGGSAWEEVNELARGANYGWPKSEGHTGDPAFKSPLHAYPPVIGRSVTGGTFYPRSEAAAGVRRLAASADDGKSEPPHVSRYPAKWRGKFFFADWAAHWVKALDPASPTNVATFARNLNGPVAVEVAPDGSLLVLNRGTIWRDGKKFAPNTGSLVRIRHVGETVVARAAGEPAGAEKNPLGLPARAYDLPKRWSALGVETALAAAGRGGQALAYAVNAPEWHPGVQVDRTIVLPRGARIGFSVDGDWRFPPGTVFLRDHSVQVGGQPRLIERRIVVMGTARSYGASYRVAVDGKDATLVEDGELADFSAYGAKTGDRLWFFPPMEPALTFPAANLAFTLDCNTAQLNRAGADGENQLAAWNRRGLFDPPLNDSQIAGLPRLASLDDTSATPELRVRSYLDVNCAVCHRPGGASRGLFDARFATPLARAGILDGDLAAGDLGIPGAKVVVPGSPEKSILYQRLKRDDFFRMPPAQFHNEPSPALPVMEAWIRSLGSR